MENLLSFELTYSMRVLPFIGIPNENQEYVSYKYQTSTGNQCNNPRLKSKTHGDPHQQRNMTYH